jgi:pyroglutamyl-peptidase
MSPPRIRVAVAGFGPFPGVPRNPSGEIARALARRPRFRTAGVILDTAVFPTAYGAAQAGLEKLLAKSPAAVVLFGVAGGAKHIRVETRAHNRVSILHPDHMRFVPTSRKLSSGGAPVLKLRGSALRMRAAIRQSGSRAELSINAGSYLCNAVFYRALAAAAAHRPPPLTYFIHVPPAGMRSLSMRKLVSAGEAAVWLAAHEAIRARAVPHRDG